MIGFVELMKNDIDTRVNDQMNTQTLTYIPLCTHTFIYIQLVHTISLSLHLSTIFTHILTHTHNFPHSNDSKRMISRFISATQICRSNTVLHSFHPNTHRTVFVFLLALTARDSFHSEYNSYHYPLVRLSHWGDWGDCDSALVQ